MTPLCFLHGFAAGGAVWNAYLDLFPRSLTPTLRFYANGTPILPELPSPAILVGWSLGGMIAVEMAARQPEKVKALVLISSAPSFAASDLFPEGKPLSVLREMRSGIARNDTRILQSFQRQLFTAAEIRQGWLTRFRREIGPILTKEIAASAGRGDHAMPLSEYRGNEAARTEDTATSTLLAQIAFLERWCAPKTLPTPPIIILHGDGDSIISVAAVAAWRKLFPHAQYSIVTGGHALPFTHHEMVITAIHKVPQQ